MRLSNLWAPWRIGYIRDVVDAAGGCFLCDYVCRRKGQPEELEVWRSTASIVVLNRFPYNNGHLLVAPLRHIAGLVDATCAELTDLMMQVKVAQSLLGEVLHPHGFNVGINLGTCAGAGLVDHLHVHVVPRWNGDTNFVSVCSDAKVISQSLSELRGQLLDRARETGLLDSK